MAYVAKVEVSRVMSVQIIMFFPKFTCPYSQFTGNDI